MVDGLGNCIDNEIALTDPSNLNLRSGSVFQPRNAASPYRGSWQKNTTAFGGIAPRNLAKPNGGRRCAHAPGARLATTSALASRGPAVPKGRCWTVRSQTIRRIVLCRSPASPSSEAQSSCRCGRGTRRRRASRRKLPSIPGRLRAIRTETARGTRAASASCRRARRCPRRSCSRP